MLENSIQALLTRDVVLAQDVIDREENFVDPLFKAVIDFVTKLLLREDLTQAHKKRSFQIKNLLMDIERIGDMGEDISQLAINRTQDDVCFSDAAMEELSKLGEQARQTYDMALQAFASSDRSLGAAACALETEFDTLYWKIRQQHIERLDAGVCTAEANVIYTEVIRLLERISDHADNIGVSVMRL
jgi:phosphate:Na+ symporter